MSYLSRSVFCRIPHSCERWFLWGISLSQIFTCLTSLSKHKFNSEIRKKNPIKFHAVLALAEIAYSWIINHVSDFLLHFFKDFNEIASVFMGCRIYLLRRVCFTCKTSWQLQFLCQGCQQKILDRSKVKLHT